MKRTEMLTERRVDQIEYSAATKNPNIFSRAYKALSGRIRTDEQKFIP